MAYCRGLTDKEVAALLFKSYWTIKTQKKLIYQKLGVSKDTELMAYMICERKGVRFSIKKLREQGIELLTNDDSTSI